MNQQMYEPTRAIKVRAEMEVGAVYFDHVVAGDLSTAIVTLIEILETLEDRVGADWGDYKIFVSDPDYGIEEMETSRYSVVLSGPQQVDQDPEEGQDPER